jgi:hypothetical protein
MDLGRRIYARYRFSPGVVQLEPGSGVANDVLGFSDRLPLLHILHQRWSLDRASFPILDNPIWLRLRSQLSSPERHTMVARVAASHPPAALPMGPPASNPRRLILSYGNSRTGFGGFKRCACPPTVHLARPRRVRE